MPWFRFYDTSLDDPKVQRLPDPAFRAWVNILCLASRNDGKIPEKLEDLSFALRKSAAKTREVLQILISVGLIDTIENGFEPHNWHVRQYKSDVSTERVKRFRKRSGNTDETPPDTEQNRTEQNQNRTDMGFDDFWDAFPRKIERIRAQEVFSEAVQKASPAMLVAAARKYSARISLDKTETRFVKSPVGWLEDERWLDFPYSNGKVRDPENEAFQKMMREKHGYE